MKKNKYKYLKFGIFVGLFDVTFFAQIILYCYGLWQIGLLITVINIVSFFMIGYSMEEKTNKNVKVVGVLKKFIDPNWK